MSWKLSARDELSKWLMRTIQAGRVLRIPLLGVTAFSTTITALRGTSLEQYTSFILAAFMVGILGFIWAYDYFKVLNYQNRWSADRSNNYVGPEMAIDKVISARQFAVMSEGIKEDKSMEEIEKELERVTEESLRKYRDGIDLSSYSS